jgi:hypothetical protein
MGEELGGERRVWYFEARLRRERLWCMRVELVRRLTIRK